MTITPEQARKARSASVATTVTDLAERIDAYLASSRPTISGEWFFAIRDLSGSVIEEVIRRYEEAGWSVRQSHDRDGSALVFKESRP